MPEIPATVTRSLHGAFLQDASPDWLVDAPAQRRIDLKNTDPTPPDWYTNASRAQRKALHDSLAASLGAQTRLDRAMVTLQDIDTFAAPLLIAALKDRFNVQLDIHKTWLQLNKPVEMGIFAIDIDHFEVLKLPLLQAALHNFERVECIDGAFHESSGFHVETSTPGTFAPLSTQLTVEQFTGLCRSLDIGAKYQAYLKDYLHPADGVADQALREKFTAAHKTALRAAAEVAVLKGDIGREDYASILSILAGELHPRQGNRQIWFRDLGLMGRRMVGCVLFTICEKYRYSDDAILYIPGDPEHPLKRYRGQEIAAMFKRRFTARDSTQADAAEPNAYQRFFSQFVAYADRPRYFSQFTEDTPDRSFGERLAPYEPLLNEFIKALNPLNLVFTGIRQLPSAPAIKQVPNTDPYLAPTDLSRKGHGIWAENIDLWDYLFGQHRDRLIADARSHAVPTADVDAKVRSQKLAALLNIGMLVLTGVSMFVPVLGEVMMVVMAGQLLEETFEGAIEWSEGDRRAATAHLVDVAQNLALLAVMAGAGKGIARLAAAKSVPVIEGLDQVELPDATARLWKPDLRGYESPVALDQSMTPNALGQYETGSKNYIRLDGRPYEQTYDQTLQKWRIRHPSDPHAYQPILTHNGAGAWRHTLERPQRWDRLTLLRRTGHITERFSDAHLLAIADVSGVSDNALRKMHLDQALPPPELVDAMRLFEVDRDVGEVIEQVLGRSPIDEHYLHILALLPEMPRWPSGRVLQVYENADLTGSFTRYGSESTTKAPIRISRADVLRGELPTRMLATLDEAEIVGLLGGEPARVPAARAPEFARQIADLLQTRRPALFDSLSKRSHTVEPRVAKLQRVCPGLTEQAAKTVLRQADSDELARLDTSARVPLHLQELSRWYAQEGRMMRAISGLYSETMASTDTARLALHTLERLAGWSSDIRLEIRAGSINGALIDGIGNDAALTRKYLVKNGTSYQAFNSRAEALNSVPGYGDNFYSSLMHALPDETRQALGVPRVNQSADLRRAIIDHALSHRRQSTQILQAAAGPKPWFNPPRRISATLRGYPASGRGEGVDPALTSRVQDVYPLDDAQARRFILEQWRTGKNDQQIFHLLNLRLREWTELETALNQWLASQDMRLQIAEDEFRRVAQNIRNSWRNSPLAAHEPHAAQLTLTSQAALPRLTADFAHVRELTLRAPSAADTLTAFPNLEQLDVLAPGQTFGAVFARVKTMRHLTRLKLRTPINDQVASRIRELTRLEDLELHCTSSGANPVVPTVLNVSGMRQLRRLEIDSPQMGEWPLGVLDLPRLERLNLRRTSIKTLPVELYEAHERLLSGLSLDWSKFSRRTFKPIYEFIKVQPQHLIDLEEMVRDYCRGELKRFVGMESSLFDVLSLKFSQQWPGADARFQAIEALSAQFGEINALEQWVGPEPTVRNGGHARAAVADALKTSWRNGLFQRYGSKTENSFFDLYIGMSGDASVLDILGSPMDNLPPLPSDAFAHVRILRLAGLEAPVAQLRDFIRTFTQIDTLDLSHCRLSELPLTADDLPALEYLNLHNNPITSVDVRGMNRLKALDLSATAIRQWPTGAEDLPQLTWLDLGDSQLTSVPEAVLARDELLLDTNLNGTPLTPQGEAGVAAARQRIEQTRGLSAGTLQRFALEEPRHRTPPKESGSVIARRLLPLPPSVPAGEGVSWLAKRLQRLRPNYQEEHARLAIERMQLEGLSEVQISGRIDEWTRTFESLTRRLNDWLFIHESHGANWTVSSQTRQLAARRVMQCWYDGLLDWNGFADRELNFDGLQVGNFPELPAVFPRVNSLNLAGTRISSDGSNGFLRAFSQIRRLNLNANDLRALPEPVSQMHQLQRLELSFTGLVDPQALNQSLSGLAQLQWLDLSHNSLRTFSVTRLQRLERLDLRDNLMTDWPEGALQSAHLQAIDLSNNEVVAIPPAIYDGSHDALLAGTNLSENYELSQQSLLRLREYSGTHGRNDVLGLTYADIDRMIDDMDSTTESDEETPDSDVEPDEQVPILEESVLDQQVTPWIENIPQEDADRYRAMWQRVAAEPGNAAFFHLLSVMPDTEEFRIFRADLTRRVWEVMEAADGSQALRDELFPMAATHTTCVDGRTLAFSEMEVKVFEHNTLQNIQPGLASKGRALLDLSRQLFRLGEVEALARVRGGDPAEVRLEYRIGLTSGWRDGLQLPGQPSHMRFGKPISGRALDTAREAVEKAERSQKFYEELITRDYWVQYIEEKYPTELSPLKQRADEKLAHLEDEHEDLTSSAYQQAVQVLEIERTIERNLKLIELSRRETGEPMSVERDDNRPGTSRDLTG
ncbi:NEL-type E3 ubiquitin ligase domain-containing protein [Pseudomonas sp. TWP3-1]|uniref:NEL-type E3 ubiquitin ligase domain-containing protein n=1 Tax=Pseudomonas sp. TWP3-1 TaxID=2804631 RepID=UPI003CECB9DE